MQVLLLLPCLPFPLLPALTKFAARPPQGLLQQPKIAILVVVYDCYKPPAGPGSASLTHPNASTAAGGTAADEPSNRSLVYTAQHLLLPTATVLC
jgi:hypothetical protein